jgi:hypothetical protein
VQFDPVHQEVLRTAIDLLAQKSWVPLEEEQVEQMTGGKIKGGKAFLVRALCANKATGAFSVWESNNVVVVMHSSLGSGPGLMERQPLVIHLEKCPKDVFVGLSIAR